MMSASPHYLLYSELSDRAEAGRWRFVLRASDGSVRLEVEEIEPEVRGDRLELLTVVRALEALEQPSRVTLVTPSIYVREGIRHGVAQWRRSGWRWERFGQMVPVKNLDLWQRIDRAMQYHQIDCRTYRIDPPHSTVPEDREKLSTPCEDTPFETREVRTIPCTPRRISAEPWLPRASTPLGRHALQYRLWRFAPALRRRIFARLLRFRRRLARR